MLAWIIASDPWRSHENRRLYEGRSSRILCKTTHHRTSHFLKFVNYFQKPKGFAMQQIDHLTLNKDRKSLNFIN